MHRVSGNSISFGQMKESIIKELLLISYRCIKYFILQIIFMIFLSFFLKCFLYFFGGWGGWKGGGDVMFMHSCCRWCWGNVMVRWSSNYLHLHSYCHLMVVTTPLRVCNLSNQINKHQTWIFNADQYRVGIESLTAPGYKSIYWDYFFSISHITH